MASVKFVAVSRGLKDILDYVTNREKTTDRLVTGVNCVAESALDEFEAVKKQFRKTDGRGHYHIVQAFSPEDPLDFETAHQIGLEFAQQFVGYQCIVATHMNTAHKHNRSKIFGLSIGHRLRCPMLGPRIFSLSEHKRFAGLHSEEDVENVKR